MIQVVNIKSPLFITYRGACEYIGRAMPGRSGSTLGNLVKLRSEAERAEVLAKYEAWLRQQLQTSTAQRREIERLTDMARDQDLALACWCAPKACHGDVVKHIIEERLRTYGD